MTPEFITTSAIKNAYAFLKSATDLSPRNDKTNKTLSHLVLCLTCAHKDSELCPLITEHPNLLEEKEHLPALCGKAEVEMERFYAQLYEQRDSLTFTDLEEFIYYQQYNALCQKELCLLKQIQSTPNRIIFLGSGPLPMSLFIMAKNLPNTTFIGIDCDDTALNMSQKLTDKLEELQNISFVQSFAEDFLFTPSDIVICASLITQKPCLFEHLFQCGVSHFIVRDAEQAYCYLYKPAEIPNSQHYTLLSSSQCDHLSINTSKLYKIQQNPLQSL